MWSFRNKFWFLRCTGVKGRGYLPWTTVVRHYDREEIIEITLLNLLFLWFRIRICKPILVEWYERLPECLSEKLYSHLTEQNCLLKSFLRTLILITQVSLDLLSALKLLWNKIPVTPKFVKRVKPNPDSLKGV